MTESTVTETGQSLAQPEGLRGFVNDWSSDQRSFKGVPWGKAMMWIFLLSDTFIFSIFLLSYMTVRMSTTVEWPNPSEVFALSMGGDPVPLLLIAIMTFILISSSGTMAMAVMFGYKKDRRTTAILMLVTTTVVAQEETNYQGLPTGEGIMLVLESCTACHSADIILQNHMSRKAWEKTIALMQKERGMGKLNKRDRKIILDYLTKFQGIDGSSTSSKTIRKKNNSMYDFDYMPNPL